MVGENNYYVAKEDTGSCDSCRRSAVSVRLYNTARLLVSVVPICTDSVVSLECLHS